MRVTSRKIHRWLSAVIGIQLLLWALSGLVFSWSPIDQVRGEDKIRLQKETDLASFPLVDGQALLSDPDCVPTDYIVKQMKLKPMLGRPVFEIMLSGAEIVYVLVDAVTGERLSPISSSQAEDIALNDFSETAEVLKCDYLDKPEGGHSEYRSKEIPVWRVKLDHPSGTVIYVSANRGEVVARRNNRWRVFDFFWMLHTMDYKGRDYFNSWLLRIMSLLGVVSVLVGYWLWFQMKSTKVKKFLNGVYTRRPNIH